MGLLLPCDKRPKKWLRTPHPLWRTKHIDLSRWSRNIHNCIIKSTRTSCAKTYGTRYGIAYAKIWTGMVSIVNTCRKLKKTIHIQFFKLVPRTDTNKAKKKWRNLRDKFVKKRRRHGSSSSMNDDEGQREFYNSLMFLDGHVNSRKWVFITLCHMNSDHTMSAKQKFVLFFVGIAFARALHPTRVPW